MIWRMAATLFNVFCDIFRHVNLCRSCLFQWHIWYIWKVMDDSSNIWLVHSFTLLSRSLVIYRICHCYPQRIHCLFALARYVKLRVAHAPGMPGTFSPPLRVSDPDMHHGTCVTHVPWCMPESLSSSFLWSRWRGKSSRYSPRMRNSEFYVSGKRPIQLAPIRFRQMDHCRLVSGLSTLVGDKMCLWDPGIMVSKPSNITYSNSLRHLTCCQYTETC